MCEMLAFSLFSQRVLFFAVLSVFAQLLKFSCRYEPCTFMQIHGGWSAGDTVERGPHHRE